MTASDVEIRSRGRKPTVRTRQVAEAALACFCDGGFRLTQIAHVAARLGVSVGAIYRHVDSKEALFHLAAQEAAGEAGEPPGLPLRVEGLAETADLVRRVARRDRLWSRLEAALTAQAPADKRSEAEAIAEQLYDSMARRAPLIRLLDRCAHEIPELAQIFDVEVRQTLMRDLNQWVRQRGLAGAMDVASAAALTRGAMEAIAWLAKTRRGDPTAAQIGEAEARAAAVRLFTRAFDL